MLKRNLIYKSIVKPRGLPRGVSYWKHPRKKARDCDWWKKALAIAVKQRGEQRRWTSLRLRLEENQLEPKLLIIDPIEE